MKCPGCSHMEDKVVDSRSTKEGEAIRRRRECLKCGRRFTTYEYIEKAPFLVLATADTAGRMDASPKGDGPGFCLIEDDRTLLVPERPGNKLAYGLENILANPRVGLIFLLPGIYRFFGAFPSE